MDITSNQFELNVQQPFRDNRTDRSMSDVSVIDPLYFPDLARFFLLYDLYKQNSTDDRDFKGEVW